MTLTRRRLLATGGPLLSLGIMAACAVPTRAPTASPSPMVALEDRHLLVLHTNDVMGYVDPCG